MKKRIISILTLCFISGSLISCSKNNSENNELLVDDYLKLGATLEGYSEDGIAILKDRTGRTFYYGETSTHIPVLDENGVIVPAIVVEGQEYYLKEFDVELPSNTKKVSLSYVLNSDLFDKNINKEMFKGKSLVKLTTVYVDGNNSNEVYTSFKGIEGYWLWEKQDNNSNKSEN